MSQALEAPQSGGGDVPSEFAGFFENLRREVISFPHCQACERLHWYPMKRCPHCFSPDLDWRPISGAARLYSWTTVMRGFSDEFRGRVPYVVALVEFPEAPGLRLITNIVEAMDDELAIGMEVEPVFAGRNGPNPLVHFRPKGERRP